MNSAMAKHRLGVARAAVLNLEPEGGLFDELAIVGAAPE
jgi:hypothetical protein